MRARFLSLTGGRIGARWRDRVAMLAIVFSLFSFSGTAAASYATIAPGDGTDCLNYTYCFYLTSITNPPTAGAYFSQAYVELIGYDTLDPVLGGVLSTGNGGIDYYYFQHDSTSGGQWEYGQGGSISIDFTGSPFDQNWTFSAVGLQAYSGLPADQLTITGNSDHGFTYQIGAPVPEPASLALLGLGLAGLGFSRRRRKA